MGHQTWFSIDHAGRNARGPACQRGLSEIALRESLSDRGDLARKADKQCPIIMEQREAKLHLAAHDQGVC